MTRLFVLFVILTLTIKTKAQTLPRLSLECQNINGVAYKTPWVGGLNCPQFSPIDLNNDGKQDIFIFDRIGNVRLTFLNTGNGFEYTPQYLANFPELNDWALLRDFNGDGIADIFTFNDGAISGIRIFKGKMLNNQITFDRMNFATNGNILNYPLSNGIKTNLYVNSVDIPAIDDIDSDGDLDILTFEVGGGHVYYFKNQSIERGFKKDSLIYQLDDNCWGHFLDNGFQNSVKLGTADVCANSLKNDGTIVARHPGASLTTYDRDNDGDKDLLIGSISFENLSDLTNAGTIQNAWVSTQDNRFPANTEGVNLPSFPAAHFIDVDNDGKKDIIVTPNSTNFIENYNVTWFYKNTGTATIPAFQLQQKDFLVRDMLDLGSGANPTLVDVDADGLQDLIIGNYSYFKPFNERDARLFYFKNIGSAAVPKFKLTDDNWLNFKSLSGIDVNNFAPTFGDLDGDGDLDMLVGEDGGTLIYVENQAGANRPMSMAAPISGWKNIQAGSTCKPQLVDLNRDGLLDIVTGTRVGILRYFQNIGTKTQPQFNSTATTVKIGNVDVGEFGTGTGFAAPYFIDFKGKYTLFIGSESGKISVYDSIDNNLTGSWRLITNDYGKIRDGERTVPVLKNINSDGKIEMLIGNNRGGITAYTTTYNLDGTTPTDNLNNTLKIYLYPNPASDILTLKIPYEGAQLNVFNAMGQLFKTVDEIPPQYALDIHDWAKGLYFIQIKVGVTLGVVKFVKE